MVMTHAEWRYAKPLRRAALKGKYRYEWYEIIQKHQREKSSLKKMVYNNDTTMREITMKILLETGGLARMVATKTSDPTLRAEQKEIARKSYAQARSMRLDHGLPKYLAARTLLPFFVGPNGLIPHYQMEDIVKSDAQMYGISFMINGAVGKRIIEAESRLRHKGFWGYEQMFDVESTGTYNGKPVGQFQWIFWFFEEADLMMFKLKYAGKYAEV